MRAFSYPRTRSKSTARFRLAASARVRVAYLEVPVDLVANPDELVGFLEEPDEASEARRRRSSGAGWHRHPYAAFRILATCFAKYVMIRSAPARLKAVIVSMTTASSSTWPSEAAAFSITYSPLTL